MKIKNAIAVLACAASFAAFADDAKAAAGADAPAKKILMIGNSFSICVLEEMPAVVESMGGKMDLVSLYIGGCVLERHAKNIKKPDTSPYRVTWHYDSLADQDAVPFMKHLVRGKNGKDWMGNIPAMLAADKWDVVTLQQGSVGSWRPETYEPFAGELVALVRSLAPQAEIVVQETWSYAPENERLAKWGVSQYGMYSRLHEAYGAFASRYGFRVVPTGTAVQNLRARLKGSPLVELLPAGDICGGDKLHLCKAGNYLQGLVWAKALFGFDVRKCPYEPLRKGFAPLAAVMREIAAETEFCRPPADPGAE